MKLPSSFSHFLSSIAFLFAVSNSAHGQLSLNELLVINLDGPEDKDGDLSAWVEIHNDSEESLELGGYYLTDDADELTKWEIPKRSVPAGGYTVLWVSGKDFSSLFSPDIHTTFKLPVDPDYLGLVAPDGTTVVDAYENIPKQRPGFSYGIGDDGESTFFSNPTPLDANSNPIEGFVSDTKFSVDRGFYKESFEVEITTETEDAVIYYTTSGREPSKGNVFTGPIEHIYDGPILIDKTTVLRAQAYKNGMGPSDIDTQTYIFVEDVIKQDTMRTQITESEEYGPHMEEALTALPSISIAVEDARFVGSGTSGTNDVESPTSVEWLNPDGSKGFQIDAGISRFGGYFTNFPKKSFRLYFRKRYGEATLKYPIYRGHESGRAPTEEFDSISLRSGSHDMQQRGAYMSNRFVDDSLLEMGTMAPHGRFIHMYLNGVYWGHFHLRERWNAALAASYFGGREEDYDAVNGNDNFTADLKAYDGTLDFWREVQSLAREDNPWTVIHTHVDMPDYADFMLLWSTGDSESEFQAIGSKKLSVPFKFYMKDADGWLRRPSAGRITNVGPGRVLGELRSEDDPEFAMFIADRIHKHYFNDGALTDERNIERLQRRVDEIKVAFYAEAARWNFRSPQSWQTYQDNLFERHFPGLADSMVGRYEARGLYPDKIQAPTFLPHGGELETGATVKIQAGTLFNPQGGKIYYTIDGSDPRLPGGDLSDTAREYDREGEGFALEEAMVVRARTFVSSIFNDGTWSPLTEATFQIGKRPQPGDLIISEIHYRPAAPTADEMEAGFESRGVFEFIELYNASSEKLSLYDAALTAGIDFSFDASSILELDPGNVVLLVRNQAAFERRYGTGLPIAGTFENFKLSNSGERLLMTLRDGTVIQEIRYNDKEPWPESPDGDGPSLELKDPTSAADPNEGNSWQASAQTGGSPGVIGDLAPPVADDDQDNDGLSKFLENALGTSDLDPTSGPSAFAISQRFLEVNGNASVYWVATNSRAEEAANLAFTLEETSDLLTWENASEWELVSDESGILEWRSALPIDQTDLSSHYLRVRVAQ